MVQAVARLNSVGKGAGVQAWARIGFKIGVRAGTARAPSRLDLRNLWSKVRVDFASALSSNHEPTTDEGEPSRDGSYASDGVPH